MMLAVALGLGSARPVTAQTSRYWDAYCTVGAFQACMSVGLTLTQIPYFNGFASQITVSIANLQGTWNGLGGLDAWAMSQFMITGLGTDRALLPNYPAGTGFWEIGNVAYSFVGDAGLNNPAVNPYGLWYTAPERDFASGYIERGSTIADFGQPIEGCSAMPERYPGYPQLGGIRTCNGGRVEYSFIGSPLEFTDSTAVSITGYSIDGQQIACTFGADCQPMMVTPEPVTLALVGSGLAGIAGAVRRKKRREASGE